MNGYGDILETTMSLHALQTMSSNWIHQRDNDRAAKNRINQNDANIFQ